MVPAELPAVERPKRRILAVDAAANYLLGIPLLTMPRRTADLLGLPSEVSGFYQRVLGGVLTGVATALAIEHRRRNDADLVGLGAAGAVAVNALGGGAVALWLVSGEAAACLPARGRALLWGVAGGVLGIGAVEAWHEVRVKARDPGSISAGG